jgi:hypothetical protein
LGSEHFFDVIVLAYEYKCEQLKQSISNFLASNPTKGYFTKLLMTQEWQDFAVNKRELANEIMDGIFGAMGTKY